jgi:SAM-dependent methyltransferase
MRTRESGMPEESMWDQFFSPTTVLTKLGLTAECGDVVDFGCGYGTFTIPAAQIVRGVVHALDIEPVMVAMTAEKARAAGLTNVRTLQRDFVAEGTGLPNASADFVMLFNILHAEEPQTLLREAWRVLAGGGRLAIMHWKFDATTPRGPSMAIRPKPEQCREWAESAGFSLLIPDLIDLPPYHYGIVLAKPLNDCG